MPQKNHDKFVFMIQGNLYTFNPENETLRKRGREIIAKKNIRFAKGRIEGNTFIMKKQRKTNIPAPGLYVLFGDKNTPEVLGPILLCWGTCEE